jgi:hypothetical protein
VLGQFGDVLRPGFTGKNIVILLVMVTESVKKHDAERAPLTMVLSQLNPDFSMLYALPIMV